MSTVDLLAPPTEAAIESGIAAFIPAVRSKYGDRLVGVYLFGSRARGDYKPFSDVDVAIVLNDADDRSLVDPVGLSGLAYDVFFETGAEIQPWVFDSRDWADPGRSVDKGLLRSVQRDSRALWVRE